MRRVLAILKYVPAALCGLLMVAWLVSCKVVIGDYTPVPGIRSANAYLDSFRGSLKCQIEFGGTTEFDWFIRRLEPEEWEENNCLGRIDSAWMTANEGILDGEPQGNSPVALISLELPFALLLTMVLPLALAAFFRFPLWSYFAWTALIAAELAYYLR